MNFHSKCNMLGGVEKFFIKAFLCRLPHGNLPSQLFIQYISFQCKSRFVTAQKSVVLEIFSPKDPLWYRVLSFARGCGDRQNKVDTQFASNL